MTTIIIEVTDDRHNSRLYGCIFSAHIERVAGREFYRFEEQNPRLTHYLTPEQVRVLSDESIPPEFRDTWVC
jgi:hypothetical protein